MKHALILLFICFGCHEISRSNILAKPFPIKMPVNHRALYAEKSTLADVRHGR
jgi:hypothetical protein